MDGVQRCRDYQLFLETMSPETLFRLDELAAPDVRFRDPFNDTRGRAAMKHVFRTMFADIDDPRFSVTHCACGDEVCFLRWHFTCRPRFVHKGHPWVIDGVTELHYDFEGRVSEHIDYWDAGRYVYERLPVFGWLMKKVRRRMSAREERPARRSIAGSEK